MAHLLPQLVGVRLGIGRTLKLRLQPLRWVVDGIEVSPPDLGRKVSLSLEV